MTKLLLVGLYPRGTLARYLLSCYVLKAYLAQNSRAQDLCIEVENFGADAATAGIVETITSHRPDYVGYSCYSWNIEKVLAVAGEIRTRLGCRQVFGGPEISTSRIASFPDPTIADHYVIGEGELPLLDILAGHYVGSNATRDIDLDSIPSAYLSGAIDNNLWTRQQAFIETQRGCRFRCRYCVYHKNLPTIRYYSLKRVFAEIDYVIREGTVQALRFIDGLFTSDLQRAKEIVAHLLELKNEGIRLPWIYWEFTPDSADDELLRMIAALKSSESIDNVQSTSPLDRPQHYSELLRNYVAINCIGIQSLYKPALAAVGRGYTSPARLQSFLESTRRHNVVLKMDLILGLPQETRETYYASLDQLVPLLKDTDHILNIHRLEMLPGSTLEEISRSYGLDYSTKAPHTVFSTAAFPVQDMHEAALHTAVLFRVLNSPLRPELFHALMRTGNSPMELIRRVFHAVTTSPELKRTRIARHEPVDDLYWNDMIFRELPTSWLLNCLRELV